MPTKDWEQPHAGDCVLHLIVEELRKYREEHMTPKKRGAKRKTAKGLQTESETSATGHANGKGRS